MNKKTPKKKKIYNVKFFEENGRKGGLVTFFRRGSKYFSKIGKLGRKKQLDIKGRGVHGINKQSKQKNKNYSK